MRSIFRTSDDGGIHQRIDRLEDVVVTHSNTLATTVESLRNHVDACNKRGARQEKGVWIILGAVLAILGFLLEPYFSGRPQIVTIASNPAYPPATYGGGSVEPSPSPKSER